jgi:hypothetical protein
MDQKRMVNQNTLDEIIRLIVEVTHPEKIVLFGLAATGRKRPDSERDLPVIMPDGVYRRQTAQAIDAHPKGFDLAKDIVVATDGDVRKGGDNPSLVVSPGFLTVE